MLMISSLLTNQYCYFKLWFRRKNSGMPPERFWKGWHMVVGSEIKTSIHHLLTYL